MNEAREGGGKESLYLLSKYCYVNKYSHRVLVNMFLLDAPISSWKGRRKREAGTKEKGPRHQRRLILEKTRWEKI